MHVSVPREDKILDNIIDYAYKVKIIDNKIYLKFKDIVIKLGMSFLELE